MGNFNSPLLTPEKYGIVDENIGFLKKITDTEPNVVLQCMREMPPSLGAHGKASSIVNKLIDNECKKASS